MHCTHLHTHRRGRKHKRTLPKRRVITLARPARRYHRRSWNRRDPSHVSSMTTTPGSGRVITHISTGAGRVPSRRLCYNRQLLIPRRVSAADKFQTSTKKTFLLLFSTLLYKTKTISTGSSN